MTQNKWPIRPRGGHDDAGYEHTFANIVPCDDLRFNDTLNQPLDNQYPRAGHAFRRRHMHRGRVIYLLGFPSLYDAIHGWMTGRTDGRMDMSHEKASRKTTTTSFTL
jgi:hypothetical protein